MSFLKVPILTRPYTTAAYNIMERVSIDNIDIPYTDEFGNNTV